MNYRHAYHAGNFADVLKHTVLLALIEALRAKPTPFAFIETHAGSGCYALDGREAGKTGEFKDGINRLLFPDLARSGLPGLPSNGSDMDAQVAALPPLLRRWLDTIVDLPGNEDGVKLYPGSPLQAARAMRAGDSAQLCEWQPEEATRLRELFHHDARIHSHHRDGYAALHALLPPAEKRGLVLIDPPYETHEAEYRQIEKSLKAALLRWPTGVYAVWYPIKQRSQVQPFLRWLKRCGARRVLRAELLVHPDDSPLRLNGSGMVVLNAPWQLDDTLREPVRTLARLLSQDHPAEWKLDWLVEEGGEALPTPSPLPASRLQGTRGMPGKPRTGQRTGNAPPVGVRTSNRSDDARTDSPRAAKRAPRDALPAENPSKTLPPANGRPARKR